jgi:cation diffusion facilitator family transporter
MSYQALRGPILLSLLAAILTIGLKGTAYFLTGSVGLFSDALESFVNLLAATAAYFSLRYSHKPADPEHAYGHEKIEFFSSGLEGTLVFVAGLGTAWYAVGRLIQPQELDRLNLGIALTLAASAINFAVAIVLLRVGKRHGSVILEADGHHLMSDVFTSLAVIVGLGLVAVTDVKLLDPLLALLVGLNILRTGFKLVRKSFDGLMDRALPPVELIRLKEGIRINLPAGCHFHHFRTRLAGRRKFLDFHLLVPGSWSVQAGHTLAHSIETKLHDLADELEVTIHVEPIEDESSWEPAALARLGEAADVPSGV